MIRPDPGCPGTPGTGGTECAHQPGSDGALLVDETGKVHRHQAPKGTMVNTVGAGDSMVAGFLAGYLRNKDYGEALHWGICAGSATAFTMHLAEKEAIEQLVKGN